jgi:hypothetical protein
MSFAGNLEDLAIVDVIQLLHSTRKSGTLCVTSENRRSQIVFSNGFIISANHYSDSVRIGNILVEMEAISAETLEQALAQQKEDGDQSKPLIGTLIEMQVIDNDIAYKGLECLIEMTIVEMVSWHKGTFTLNVDVDDISDEYKYIPEKLKEELNFDTQMVLLDALRIYDEKRAAGISPTKMSIEDETPLSTAAHAVSPTADSGPGLDLSADILGLDSIDQIDMQVPETFTSLEAFDPSEIHRQKVRELLPDFPSAQREELVDYLTVKTNIADSHENAGMAQQETIIFYGSDELIQHGLMSACKYAGIMVFTATTHKDLENRIRQNLERSLIPVLVFDCPQATLEGFTKDDITAVRQQTAKLFPQLQSVQISTPVDYLYSLQSLTTGASTILPRSIVTNRRDTFITDLIQFLESFPAFIHGLCSHRASSSQVSTSMLNELREMKSANEIAYFLLEQTSQMFDRCLTLVLRNDELIAEKSFGIESEKEAGPSDPLRFKVQVKEDELLARVMAKGELFHSSVDDQTIRESVFGEISAPDKSKILLLPLVAAGRTLALIYADFGQSKEKSIDTEYLKSLAWLAGLALDRVIRNRK